MKKFGSADAKEFSSLFNFNSISDYFQLPHPEKGTRLANFPPALPFSGLPPAACDQVVMVRWKYHESTLPFSPTEWRYPGGTCAALCLLQPAVSLCLPAADALVIDFLSHLTDGQIMPDAH